MPYFGNTGPRTYSRPKQSYGANQVMAQETATRIHGLVDFNSLQTVGYYALGGLTDVVDTIGASIPGLSSITGQQRGDFNRFVTRSLDLPGLNDFYGQNAGGIEAISGIGIVIGSELIARRLTAPGSALMTGLRATPYLRRIAALDEQYAAALGTVRAAREELAARGLVGAQQVQGRATVETMLFDSTTGAMVPGTVTRSGRGADFKARLLGGAIGARHGAVAEAVLATAGNHNSFLYSDSAAYNIAFAAAGPVLGGAIDLVGAGYALRQIAKEDSLARIAADALDPGGLQGRRLEGFQGAAGRNFEESVDWFGGAHTDEVTELGLEVAAVRNAPLGSGDPSKLDSNRRALVTELLTQQRLAAQKVTIKGFSSDGRTGFSMSAPGYGNAVDDILYRDQMGLHLVEQMGGVADDALGTGILEAFEKRTIADLEKVESQIDELVDVAAERGQLTTKQTNLLADLQTRRRRLNYQKSFTLHGVIDGELVPPSMLATYERFTPMRVFPKKIDAEKTFWEVADDALHGKNHLIGDNLEVVLPKGKNLSQTDYFDMLALYRIGNTAIDSLARKADVKIALPKNPSWFQLDMAEALLVKSEGRAAVMFPRGMTRESAQVESLIQKAEALKKLDAKGVPRHVEENQWMHQNRVRFNLPRLSAYEVGLLGTEAHPIEFLMRGMGNHSPDEIRAMSLDEIKEAVAQVHRLGDAAPVTRRDVKTLTGNSFTFMKDYLGNDMKPLVAATRPFKPWTWTEDAVAERLAMRKAKALHELIGPDADALSRELGQALTQSPDFPLASRPDQILESQIQGSIVGFTPQSFGGALTKELKPSEMNFRDAPGLLAAGRLRDLAGRIGRARMKDVIEGAFGDSLKLLKNARNAPTKLLLNQFHSFRGGWDLAPRAIENEAADGAKVFSFKLEDTAENRSRWQRLFNERMPDNAMLVGLDKQKVVLDEQGLEFQKAFNKVTDEIIQMQNTVLRANGMGQIRAQNWYVTPQEIEGKHVGWVFGPDNKPISVVTADTADQFAKAADAELAKVIEGKPNSGIGYVFMTREQVTDYMSIWDRAMTEMTSPGRAATLPGKRNTGGLSSANIRLDAFQQSLRALETRMLNHSNDVVNLLFKEQINASKARADMAKAVAPGSESRFGSENYRTVHDYYVEALLGRSKSSAPSSIIGGFFRKGEAVGDQFLKWTAGPTARAWAMTTDRLARGTSIFDRSERARKDFDYIATQLGEHMPFRNANEMANARERGAVPLSMAKLTGGMNRFTAAITLRMMELAHPIMNLTGIVNAMPSVVRNMVPRAGETREQFASRIGHSAMIFDLPQGASMGVLDMTKLFNRALKGAWSREAHAEYDFMLQRGYITQEVAEFQRQFGAIEGRGSVERFFTGTGSNVTRNIPKQLSRSGNPIPVTYQSKGLVGWMSVLSDKSEDFSRSIGHFIGLELSDVLGIAGRERRHAFAHDIANRMIANYDPHNRAEVFQGAFGSMLGLFQSFVHNYYGRMFRYIETKDARAFATQYGVQSALFGITGLTGWDQVSGMVNWASDGDRQLDTGVQGAFTGVEGDLLAHGLISQLPKIFGLEGVDLYSRGDTSVRIPGVGNTSVPGISAMSKIAGGFVEGLSAFWSENSGLTSTRIAEIASNMVVNRPIAGLIEQFFAHGNDTDGYGQVVAETKSGAEAVYRSLGLRSERQSNELNVYYADKRAQEQQAAKKESLRLKTRAAMRESRNDLIPGIYEDYITTGGDPRYFRSWLKRNYQAATETVGTRRLDQLTRDPAAFADVMRYMDAGVGIEEDDAVAAATEQEAFPAPGPLEAVPDSGVSVGWPYGPEE